MNRTQKFKLNTTMSLTNRIVRIVTGLIMPRLILLYYGSKTNGLVASISQFLTIITFLDLGVGSVVQSALYRPIAKKDKKQVSLVLAGARQYFQRIAYILIIYIGVLILFYPILINDSHGYLSTALLILSLSISQFGQYYFGIVNELFLNANQQSYIQYTSEIVVVILNLIIGIFLITQGASIEIVKLGSGLVFLIRPVFLHYYVNKNFNIDYNIKVDEDPLPQKWNGVGQHVASVIRNSTDVIALSLIATLEAVSIYGIYNMVVQSIHMLFTSMTTGLNSFFGDLLANDEVEQMNNYFNSIEWVTHTGVVFLYGVTAVLINPFVKIYTTGVEDINYSAPLFSFILVLANAVFSLRNPYQIIVYSAGHFKETQSSSLIEAALNIILSILLVRKFGLVGVALATLSAMVYRTIYLIIYLSRNIIFRSLTKFIKHIFVDIISFVSILILGIIIINYIQVQQFTDLVIAAIILSLLSLFSLFIINLIFYKQTMKSVLKSVFKSK